MVAAVPGPPAPAAARLWFYRVDDPSLGRNVANLDLNGARIASAPPGAGPSFVDVAPGNDHIAPKSFEADTAT